MFAHLDFQIMEGQLTFKMLFSINMLKQ